jgi:hypothetical protein
MSPRVGNISRDVSQFPQNIFTFEKSRDFLCRLLQPIGFAALVGGGKGFHAS